MPERTLDWLTDHFQDRDPQDWATDLLDSVPALTGAPQLMHHSFTYQTSTFTLGTAPANSTILKAFIARTTAWDAITAFTGGKSGSTGWLWTTEEANLTGAIPAGEEQDVEEVVINKAVDTATPIVVTINQGAASQGSGYVILMVAREVAPS